MTATEFRTLIRALPEPHLLVSRTGSVLAANPPAASLLGIVSEGPASLIELVLDEPHAVDALLAQMARTSAFVPGALTLRSGARCRLQGCVLTSGSGQATDLLLLRLESDDPASSPFLTLNRTIEELTREARVRQRAEHALRESEQRALFLAEASRVLASSLNYQETLRNVARMAVPVFADWCAVDVLEPDGRLTRVAVEHTDPAKVQLAYDLSARYPPDPDAPHGVHQVIRTGRTDFMTEIPDELIVAAARDDEHLRLLRDLALRSYIVAPLAARDRILGAITFVHAESGRRYHEGDVVIADDVARRGAVAIENARLVAAIEEARDLIAGQAAELELQTDELQAQSTQLEEQTAELEHQLDEVQTLNEQLARANADLREATSLAEAARAQAERANSAKSTFLAVMSHELRTPINAILGYTDLLRAEVSGPLTETQRTQLDRVHGSSLHLIGLIDQVLNLARIEAGHTDVRSDATDLAQLTRSAVAMVEPLATRRGLTIRLHVAEPTRPVLTDAGKITQILLNLLNNAIKFTATGDIDVSLRHDGTRAMLGVRDTGTGIAAEHLARIFEPFVQLDQQMSRRTGGAGLGLAVSQQLARLLGGELRVDSTPGIGSTFTLVIPAPPADGAAPD